MKRRNPFSDLGLVIAISVFICILIKSLLFGITWGSIIWIIISCAYFVISWKFDSQSNVVKHSTTAFLVLSVIAATAVVLFDKKATPQMHAFEGTGDTIQDVQIIDLGPQVNMYETLPDDTTAYEADSVAESEEVTLDDLLDIEDENAESVPETAADSAASHGI